MENFEDIKDTCNSSYLAQVQSFHSGVYEIVGIADLLKKKFEVREIDDWPLMIQLGIILTTCTSLLHILPKEKEFSKIFIDKRTIATLIRNIIDSHDAIDFLCNHKKWSHLEGLNRTILGYYIARKAHKIMDSAQHKEIAEKYLKMLESKVNDKKKLRKIENGESILIESRKERLLSICGEEADMVGRIISDLSSYVHSVPPGLWFENSFEDAFKDNDRVRLMLCMWLQVANFYIVKVAKLVIENHGHIVAKNENLQRYMDNHQRVFGVE